MLNSIAAKTRIKSVFVVNDVLSVYALYIRFSVNKINHDISEEIKNFIKDTE